MKKVTREILNELFAEMIDNLSHLDVDEIDIVTAIQSNIVREEIANKIHWQKFGCDASVCEKCKKGESH